MKKVLLILFTTVCLVGTSQAGLVTFDFDSPLLAGADDAAIGSYMTGLYGSSVVVTGATVYPDMSGADPLPALSTGPSYQYLASTGDGKHQFSISFSVPIVSVSFNWARADDNFHVEASYADITRKIFGATGGGSGYGSETIDLLDVLVFGGPVTTLVFRDGGKGAIGIDNLVVNAVPLPTSILLSAFAVGLAGRKLRRFV